MRLLLVDSYDSFTHNLVQAFRALGCEVDVVTADTTGVDAVVAARHDAVVLGPGPGRPEDSGCLVELARSLGHTPVLGVCLGHQAIGIAFGGRVVRNPVVHGHATPIHHDGTGVFAGLPPSPAMGRYHSLVIDPTDLPAELRVTARADDGSIQGLAHRTRPIHGIQFHPESVLSGSTGMRLLDNFLALAQPAGRVEGVSWRAPAAASDRATA